MMVSQEAMQEGGPTHDELEKQPSSSSTMTTGTTTSRNSLNNERRNSQTSISSSATSVGHRASPVFQSKNHEKLMVFLADVQIVDVIARPNPAKSQKGRNSYIYKVFYEDSFQKWSKVYSFADLENLRHRLLKKLDPGHQCTGGANVCPMLYMSIESKRNSEFPRRHHPLVMRKERRLQLKEQETRGYLRNLLNLIVSYSHHSRKSSVTSIQHDAATAMAQGPHQCNVAMKVPVVLARFFLNEEHLSTWESFVVGDRRRSSRSTSASHTTYLCDGSAVDNNGSPVLPSEDAKETFGEKVQKVPAEVLAAGQKVIKAPVGLLKNAFSNNNGHPKKSNGAAMCCGVCNDEAMHKASMTYMVLDCGHRFHDECILNHLNAAEDNGCPVCAKSKKSTRAMRNTLARTRPLTSLASMGMVMTK